MLTQVSLLFPNSLEEIDFISNLATDSPDEFAAVAPEKYKSPNNFQITFRKKTPQNPWLILFNLTTTV